MFFFFYSRILSLFCGVDMHSIVPRSDAFTADALIGGSIFSGSYSFSVEPQFLLSCSWAQ